MAIMTFANAINEALTEAMTLDPDVICYGLGVPDPKGETSLVMIGYLICLHQKMP